MSASTPSLSPESASALDRLRGEDALVQEFEAIRTAGATARLYLEAVREELRQLHMGGASGSEIVRLYTAAVDEKMIRDLM